MSSVDNPYRSWGITAADAPADERTSFIRQTYLHLGGAVLAFVALEAVLLQSAGRRRARHCVLGTSFGWLLVLGGFMLVSYVASSWANSPRVSARNTWGWDCTWSPRP